MLYRTHLPLIRAEYYLIILTVVLFSLLAYYVVVCLKLWLRLLPLTGSSALYWREVRELLPVEPIARNPTSIMIR